MATNSIIQQVLLPQPVQQAAETEQLGPFTKVYGPNPRGTIIGASVFIVAGAFLLAGVVLATDQTARVRIILLVLGLSMLGLAISLLYNVIRVANQQVYLFQAGLVIANGQQVRAFPWSQAAEVWQRVTRNYRNGVYVGTTYIFRLRRVDGYQIKLDNLTRNIAELGSAIVQGIARELTPRALQAIQTGQTLMFGPFSVNQQGIGNGRELLPWQQVQALDVEQGRVTISEIGASQNWNMTKVAKIPNFLVFTRVAEELRRQSGGGVPKNSLLPQPVQQVAEAERLGAFIKAYLADTAQVIIGGIIILVLAAGFLVLAIFPPDHQESTRLIGLAVALGGLGIAVTLLSIYIRIVDQQVYLFQQGLVIKKRQRVQAFPWSQAASVWQKIIPRPNQSDTVIFRLRRMDGYQIKLDYYTKGIAELGPAIAQGLRQELVPRALQAIQAGQTLSFGPFSINQQGISKGRDLLPWSQVQAIVVKQGRVTISKIGTSQTWGTALVTKIPDFVVFTAATAELRRQTSD